MNPETRLFLRDLLEAIEAKTSWGKVELKQLILEVLAGIPTHDRQSLRS